MVLRKRGSDRLEKSWTIRNQVMLQPMPHASSFHNCHSEPLAAAPTQRERARNLHLLDEPRRHKVPLVASLARGRLSTPYELRKRSSYYARDDSAR